MTTTTKQFRITVDEENNAEQWWETAAEMQEYAPESVPAIGPMFMVDGQPYVDEVIVSELELAAFLCWAQSIPGWDSGPQHARYPVVINPVEATA